MKDLWDRLWREGGRGGVHNELVETVIKYTGKKAKILEVGFGSGGDLLELAKRGHGVYGVEKSGEAIRGVERKVRQLVERVRGRVKIKSGDAEELPYGDQFFDCVFHQGVMEHFKNTGKFLREQWRVLKDGGILVVDVPNRFSFWGMRRFIGTVMGTWRFGWERGYTDGELKRELGRKGFEVLGTGYREMWPPRLSKLLQPGEIVNPSLRKLAENRWVGVGAGVAGRILGEAKYGSVYAVAKRNKFFTDVAVDGRVFEAGAGGMATYALKMLTMLGGVKFWVIHQRDLKVELPSNCVSVRVRAGGKWVTDQVIIPKTLKRLICPVYWQPANMGVPVFTKSKVLLTVHDVIPAYWNEYFAESRLPLAAKWLYLVRMQIGLWKADRVMTDSPATSGSIGRYFRVRKDKVGVVELGVDKAEPGSKVSGLEGVLKRYGLKPRGYVLNHGGMDRRKNLERLVEAYARMDGGIKLVITGENARVRRRVLDKLEELGIGNKVIFTGRVPHDEIRVLVKKAKLVVYPTLAEGFGLPILEAMAAGVPVVASDLPVLRWIGGRVPYYVDPAAVESIAEGLKKALAGKGDSKSKRAKVGIDRGREFSWEKTAERISGEIEDLS